MADQYARFTSLLEDLDLKESIAPFLQENGFDDWETVKELSPEILQNLGLNDEAVIKQILACVNAANVEIPTKDMGDLDEEIKALDRGSDDDNKENLEDAKPVTLALVSKGTSLKRDKNETQDKFLGRITSLALDAKKLTHIENLDKCRNLKHLYLHNNLIVKIENLGSLRNLVHLHLQNNRIKKMDGFENLRNLQKLYLNKNLIKVVEGLESCERLERLYVSEQQTKDPLGFDPNSMVMIANSLLVLEAQKNRIKDTSALAYLSNLSVLDLNGNNIDSAEDLEQCFACMIRLNELDLRKNPVEKVPKIRDQVFMMSNSLTMFNNKEILPTEREFLYKFYNIKNARAKAMQTTDQKPKKKENDLVVSGSLIQLDDPDPSGPGVKKHFSTLPVASNLYPSHITAHSITKKIPSLAQTKTNGII